MKKITSLLLAVLLIMTLSMGAFAMDSYVIEQGDTLYRISGKVGVSIEELVELNGIENPNLIYTGDLLKLVPDYSTMELNEQLVMATAWFQQSAEMRAISYQTFNFAKVLVDMDLADETVTAETRAIVVDLDETIIDNSDYEAWLIGKDFGYSSSTWNPWIQAGIAPALPGAVEFLNYVADQGVHVYYISNRKVLDDNSGYIGTKANLMALGLPFADEEHLLLRTGSSNKTERRTYVEDQHHVILYMGDNLNDFLADFAGIGVDERLAVTDQYKAEFGKKFIVMPNPMYGEWEGSIYNFNWGFSPLEKSEARKDILRIWDH